jgi:hypothetical protein
MLLTSKKLCVRAGGRKARPYTIHGLRATLVQDTIGFQFSMLLRASEKGQKVTFKVIPVPLKVRDKLPLVIQLYQPVVAIRPSPV